MRREIQAKFDGGIEEKYLLEKGAEKLGSVAQQDTYLIGTDCQRIREEAGNYTIASKGPNFGKNVRMKEVSEEIISKNKADKLIKSKGINLVVNKKRTMYKLGESVITIDDVEHIGEFLEIKSTTEENLLETAKLLRKDKDEVVLKSYADIMAEKEMSKWLRGVLYLHGRIGEMAFGITSGILTTIGILVGINVATSSRLSVIAGIAAIAAADSFSDAFGMYMSKTSERACDKSQAVRYAMGTLAGKFFFPLTFIIPILLLPLSTAVWIDMAWGAFSLSVLSAEIAVVEQSSILKKIAANIGLAAFIVLFSGLAGSVVSKYVAT